MDLVVSLMYVVAVKSQIVTCRCLLMFHTCGCLSFGLTRIFYCDFFQPVKLAVVCRDGQLHLFEHILNG